MLDDSCNSGFHYPADLLPWCPFLYFPVECRRSLKLMPSPQLQISPQTDLHTVVSCDGKPSKDYLMPDLCRRTRSSEMWLEARILSSIPFSHCGSLSSGSESRIKSCRAPAASQTLQPEGFPLQKQATQDLSFRKPKALNLQTDLQSNFPKADITSSRNSETSTLNQPYVPNAWNPNAKP